MDEITFRDILGVSHSVAEKLGLKKPTVLNQRDVPGKELNKHE